MKRFSFLMGLLLVSEVASATIVGVNGHITRIGTGFGGEGLYLSIDTPICPNAWALFMPVTAIQYKETVSMAVTAQAQGKSVSVYYDNSTCTNLAILSAIAING